MRLYSLDEVAEIMGTPKSSVRRLVRKGKLPVVTISDRVRRVREEDLGRFVWGRRSGSEPKP